MDAWEAFPCAWDLILLQPKEINYANHPANGHYSTH
jgi:hypothetical protein